MPYPDTHILIINYNMFKREEKALVLNILFSYSFSFSQRGKVVNIHFIWT
jgi:hypothetical protein